VPTQDEVKKINALAASLVREIAKKDPK